MLTPSLAAVPPNGFPYSHRDAAWRLARGIAKPIVASLEGMDWDELDRLIARPRFARLVEAYQAKEQRSRKDWRERLIRMAYEILERAALEGDLRAARFIIYEEARGRDPAETIVAAVERAANRAERRLDQRPLEAAGQDASPSAPHGTTSPRERLTATASRDRCLFRDRTAAEDVAATGLAPLPGAPGAAKPGRARRHGPQPNPARASRHPAASDRADSHSRRTVRAGKPEAASAERAAPPALTAIRSESENPLTSPPVPDPAPPPSAARPDTPSPPGDTAATPPDPPPHGARPPHRILDSTRGPFSTAESSTPKTLPTFEAPHGPRQRDGP